jgi:Flp pilus assembly protein TadG
MLREKTTVFTRQLCGTCHRARAAAFIEFALVLVMLVLLTLGAAGMGEVLRVQLALDTAAREAARAAAATRPPSSADLGQARARAEHAAVTRARSVLEGVVSTPQAAAVSIGENFGRTAPSGEPNLATVHVRYSFQLSVASRAVLRPWFPSGRVPLEGVAHEPIPRYASAW